MQIAFLICLSLFLAGITPLTLVAMLKPSFDAGPFNLYETTKRQLNGITMLVMMITAIAGSIAGILAPWIYLW